jgi:hypothetical protein
LRSAGRTAADVVGSNTADAVSTGSATASDSGYAGIEAGRAGAVISLTEAIRLHGDIIDPQPSPFEALDERERREKIDTAVASMAPDVRAAWNGLAYDGISWSELGRREGLSDNGARKRYKPKFLDAFIAVGVGTADFDVDTVDRDRAGFAIKVDAVADTIGRIDFTESSGIRVSGIGADHVGRDSYGKNKGVKYG